MWCQNDYKSFLSSSNARLGQINYQTPVGQRLIQLVQTNRLENIIDIGTWNGLGSTLCFAGALRDNPNIHLISIESNQDKNETAKANLRPHITDKMRVDLLWGHIIREEDIGNRLYEIFPNIANDAELQRWHKIDMENCKQSPYILDKIPEQIDLVLFDGGEFTTYFEFEKLFPRCRKFIALDDVDADKCRIIRTILQKKLEWREICYIPERNGFAIFEKQI
jgi:hypothetical protein